MKFLKTYWHLLFSLLLFLMCLYMNAKGIADNSLAYDEPFSVFHAQLGVKTIIAELSKGNNPPLYEILLHFWIKVFGTSEFYVRLLSGLFMSVAAVLIFQIGRIFNFKIGILASLLFIFSNYQTAFASEARVYALFVLLTCLSMLSFLKLATGSNKSIWRYVMVISNIFIVYSHFFGFFVWFIQLFSVLLFRELRSKNLKLFLKLFLISFIFYLPYVYIFVVRALYNMIYGTWVSPVTDLFQLHNIVLQLSNKSLAVYTIFLFILWIPAFQFLLKQPWSLYLKYSLALLSIGLLLFSLSVSGVMPYAFFLFCTQKIILVAYLIIAFTLLIIAIANSSVPVLQKILIVWFGIILLIMFVLSFWVPMFLDRYVIFCIPAFYLLIALSVFQFENNLQYGLGILFIVLMAATSVRNVANNRDVRTLVSKIQEVRTKNDPVFICPDYFELNFSYYYCPEIFKNTSNTEPLKYLRKQLAEVGIYPVTSYKDIDTTLFSKVEQIIYIDAAADFSYGNNRVGAFLKNRFTKYTDFELNDIFHTYIFKVSKKQ